MGCFSGSPPGSPGSGSAGSPGGASGSGSPGSVRFLLSSSSSSGISGSPRMRGAGKEETRQGFREVSWHWGGKSHQTWFRSGREFTGEGGETGWGRVGVVRSGRGQAWWRCRLQVCCKPTAAAVHAAGRPRAHWLLDSVPSKQAWPAAPMLAHCMQPICLRPATAAAAGEDSPGSGFGRNTLSGFSNSGKMSGRLLGWGASHSCLASGNKRECICSTHLHWLHGAPGGATVFGLQFLSGVGNSDVSLLKTRKSRAPVVHPGVTWPPLCLAAQMRPLRVAGCW